MPDEDAVPAGPSPYPAQDCQRLAAAAQFPSPADPLLEHLVDEPGQPTRVMNCDAPTVGGRVEDVDPNGRTWFIYFGAAHTRQLRPIDPPTRTPRIRRSV